MIHSKVIKWSTKDVPKRERKLKNECGVYRLLHKSTGKFYVGSTSESFLTRWKGHINKFKKGKNSPLIQEIYDREGLDAFQMEVLITCKSDALLCRRLEQFCIDYMWPALNDKTIIRNLDNYTYFELTGQKRTADKCGHYDKPYGAKGLCANCSMKEIRRKTGLGAIELAKKYPHGRVADFVGKKFGAWTVLARSNVKKSKVMWLCECTCGNRSEVATTNLTSGQSIRCRQCANIATNNKRFNKDK